MPKSAEGYVGLHDYHTAKTDSLFSAGSKRE